MCRSRRGFLIAHFPNLFIVLSTRTARSRKLFTLARIARVWLARNSTFKQLPSTLKVLVTVDRGGSESTLKLLLAIVASRLLLKPISIEHLHIKSFVHAESLDSHSIIVIDWCTSKKVQEFQQQFKRTLRARGSAGSGGYVASQQLSTRGCWVKFL